MEKTDEGCRSELGVEMIRIIPSDRVDVRGKCTLYEDEVCLRINDGIIVSKETQSFKPERGDSLEIFNTAAHDVRIDLNAYSEDFFALWYHIDVRLRIMNNNQILNVKKILTKIPTTSDSSERTYHLKEIRDLIRNDICPVLSPTFNSYTIEEIHGSGIELQSGLKDSLKRFKNDWEEKCNLRVDFERIVIDDSQWKQTKEKIGQIIVEEKQREMIEETYRLLDYGEESGGRSPYPEPQMPRTRRLGGRMGVIMDDAVYLECTKRYPGLDDASLIERLVNDHRPVPADIANIIGCIHAESGSIDNAIYWFEEALEGGSIDAGYNASLCYMRKKDPDSDNRALELLRQAAESGCPEAQYEIGHCYECGLLIGKSPDNAFKWYLSSSENGLSKAHYRVAVCYLEGLGTFPDGKRGLEHLEKAMAGLCPESFYKKAIMLDTGGDANDPTIYDLYRTSAELGCPEAELTIGLFYLNGRFLNRSEEKAIQWMRMASDDGCIDASYLLGRYLVENVTDQEMMGEGVKRLNRARSDPDATCFLGECYELGMGVEESAGKAFKLYYNGASKGHARSCYNLGRLYQLGVGVDRSIDEAVRQYGKAAKKGHIPSINALAEYGLSSHRGSHDVAACIEDIRRCSESYPKSMYNLGVLLESDLIDGDRARESVSQIYRASLKNYPPACTRIAWHYSRGSMMPRDPESAMESIRKAYDGGETNAISIWDECRCNGVDLNKNVFTESELETIVFAIGSGLSLPDYRRLFESNGAIWSCFEKDGRIAPPDGMKYTFRLQRISSP